MDDKEILYSMLEREVYNLIHSFVPGLSGFSGVITKKLISLIDSYVAAFLDDEQKLDTVQLEAFAKDEVMDKISSFKKK